MILQKPIITEKALSGTEKNIYVFKVGKETNKIEVKKAVEKGFGVKVETVNILNVKPKTVRFRRQEGKKSGWKKAIVTLKKGEKLESLK